MNDQMHIQAPSLTTLPGIRHAFFTRQGGVSDGLYASLNAGLGSQDDPEHVRENRARMAAALGVAAENFVTAYQIHSPTVVVAERAWRREDSPRADALVTRMPGLAIGVTTADCGPILFADAEARVVGAAHSGWKGALTGVLEATLDAMVGLGADRARIAAAIGPMISQPNYEVGLDLLRQFTDADPENARFFAPGVTADKRQFDLPGYVAARLARAGVARVENLRTCTYADPELFFSYRRTTHRQEPDYGRHVSAIALTDQ